MDCFCYIIYFFSDFVLLITLISKFSKFFIDPNRQAFSFPVICISLIYCMTDNLLRCFCFIIFSNFSSISFDTFFQFTLSLQFMSFLTFPVFCKNKKAYDHIRSTLQSWVIFFFRLITGRAGFKSLIPLWVLQ